MNILLIADDSLKHAREEISSNPLLSTNIITEISKYEIKQIEFEFSITSFELQLTKVIKENENEENNKNNNNENNKKEEKKRIKKILSFRLSNLSAIINITNHVNFFQSKLSKMSIENSENQFLFTSEIEKEFSSASNDLLKLLKEMKGEKEELISIIYRGYPENSPELRDSLHHLHIVFNTIHLLVNIDSFLYLQIYFEEIKLLFDSLQKKKKENLILIDNNININNNINNNYNNKNNNFDDIFEDDLRGKTLKREVYLMKIEIIIFAVGFTVPIKNSPLVEGTFANGRCNTSISLFNDVRLFYFFILILFLLIICFFFHFII